MKIRKVMVVGAGVMGSGIAQVCAEHGFYTVLSDIKEEYAKQGKEKTAYFLNRKIEKQRITEQEKEAALNLIETAEGYEKGADADLVIEAATENAELKKEIFRKLDEMCKPETILVSNTSTISISMLGGITRRPCKVAGLHFFVPAPAMKLVEVTPGLLTEEETVKSLMEFAKQLGKEPVKAPDTSAFIVNRLLDPMWNEAMYLVMEGNKPEDIDKAMRLGANHPVGPLEQTDYDGLDIVLAVMEQMQRDLGDKYKPCPLLRQMVQAGLLGRKTKRGFYIYS